MDAIFAAANADLLCRAAGGALDRFPGAQYRIAHAATDAELLLATLHSISR